MQYLSAYALASLTGKEPNQDAVKAILAATGKPVDEGEVKKVFGNLKGKNIDDLIKKGQSKVGSGGSAPPAAGGKKEEKKQEKKQEKKDDKKKDEKKKDEKKKEPQPAPPAEEDDMGPGDLFG